MAKHKEIEVKWFADSVGRDFFNRKLKKFLDREAYLYRFVRVAGPDTYFSNRAGNTIRHRKSKNTHELTAKARIYKKSIKARKEVNVKLALDQPVEDVFELLSMAGLSQKLAIVKDCDIYFISGSRAHVSIVWYEVCDASGDKKIYVEVEVEGLSHRKSIRALKVWMKRMKTMFGLTRKDESDDSLYELYTGKRYRKSGKKS